MTRFRFAARLMLDPVSAEAKYCIGSTPAEHEHLVLHAPGREVREPPEHDDVDDRREERHQNRPRDAEERLLVADDEVAPDERPEQLAVVPELGDVEVRPARRRPDDGQPTGRTDVSVARAIVARAGVRAGSSESLSRTPSSTRLDPRLTSSMLATRQAPPAVVECRAMLSRVRAKVSRLVRTHVTERGRESPYYRKLTPCERGAYFRPPAPRAPDDSARRTGARRDDGRHQLHRRRALPDDVELSRRRLADLRRRRLRPLLRTACSAARDRERPCALGRPSRRGRLRPEQRAAQGARRLGRAEWPRSRWGSRRRRLSAPPSQPQCAESVLQRPGPHGHSSGLGSRMRAHAGWTEARR